jgi:G3E family GTPase
MRASAGSTKVPRFFDTSTSAKRISASYFSGSDYSPSVGISGSLSGSGPTESPSGDSAGFAVDLADQMVAAFHDGRGGNSIVALDPAADATEVALVLEHVLDSRRPRLPIVVRDVVAVTSVRELLAELFVMRRDTAASAQEEDFDRPGRLASRIEFASIIVLCDLTAARLPRGTALVRAALGLWSPAARIIGIDDVATAQTPNARLARGRARRLGSSMGWRQQLARRAEPTRDVVGAHVFRDVRPFHPGRLHEAVTTALIPEKVGRIVRSRGFVRLASRPEHVGSWSSAGDVLNLDPSGMSSWDADSPIGQEIVFFGLDLDPEVLDAALAACLLSPAELAGGPAEWAIYPDRFPAWAIEHHH